VDTMLNEVKMGKVMETGMVVDEVAWELKMLGWVINPSLLLSSEDQVLRGIDCSY
jgi:hypothetical protein